MRVCVIGAGAAGLCAIKHCLQQDLDVMGFEQTGNIGGTWVYTDKTGKDEHGLDIHSSMYRGLYTNLPKELMSFPDFPFPPQHKSYLPASEVLTYLNSYADTFNVRAKIKFLHHVVRVRPLIDESWEVIVKNLITGMNEIFIFDAVLVCNGHFSVPNVPKLRAHDSFRGRQIHSHEYRSPDVFRNQRVLVIGAGPSGTDISQEIAKKADLVFWSHHLQTPKKINATNIIQKPDVLQLNENGVKFKDGSSESIDAILYCTGYEFTFPFLSVDSNISCYDNYIQPLYKHCININRPTMAIIGIIFHNCPFQTFDLQVRFTLKFMTGRKILPSREEMLADTERDMGERWSRGLSRRKAHSFGEGWQEKYYEDLAITADVEPIKPYVTKMYIENRLNQRMDIATFRRYKFTIIDDENYETTLLP